MPIIDRLSGAAAPVFVDTLRAGAMTPLAVPGQLLRVMAAAGVTAPGDVDRLSEQQLAKIMENRTPSERIELRTIIHAAGIYPRGLPDFSAIATHR